MNAQKIKENRMRNRFGLLFSAAALCLLCACRSFGPSDADRSIPAPEDGSRPTSTEVPVDFPSSPPESGVSQAEIDHLRVLGDLSVQPEEGSKYSYLIVRREQTVLSRADGSVCSSMYYEMPVVLIWDEEAQEYVFDPESQQYGGSSAETAGISAINAVFEQECRDFWEDSAEFTLLSQDLAVRHTGPYGGYHDQLETQVTQCGDSIFSVRQITHWNTYGIANCPESGLTFRLDTGELLTLAYFIETDYDTFHAAILRFLAEQIQDDWRLEGKLDWYERLFCDYSDHRFYYKDGSLYLIFPAESNEQDWIVRWSVADAMPVEVLYGTAWGGEP